jgi:phosphoesterase RecJ-like protein
VLEVTRSMMEKTGAKEVDCEAALQESLYLPSVETALMLRENADGSLKGSLRGKSGIDLSKIAGHFGGGGHYHAAGFDLPDSKFDTVLNETLKLLDKELN